LAVPRQESGVHFRKGKAVMENLMERGQGYLDQGIALVRDWIVTPAAWSQFAALIAAWLLAVVVARAIVPRLATLITPAADSTSLTAKARRLVLTCLPLALPLLAYAFTAAGEGAVRSLFGAGEIIAFGKRVFLFLAARALVRDVLREPFLNFLGRRVLLPVAALYVVGLLDPVVAFLDGTVIAMGNISFTAMSLVRGLIAGSLLFWLGMWSNDQSAQYIGRQPMRPAIRQLALKAAEVAIFGVAFLMLMNIMGISLTSLAVIGGAIGVGIGFGLQQIAANFMSGIILLVEGQATVGDYVELDGGEAGRIKKMGARATILETYDGRWIVVPNEHFITTRVVNYSDSGSANRYDATFSVSYDTDINRVPEVINAAVEALPFVLKSPEGPDCELVGFGDSGIDFAVEYWVEGIDDGANKYKSQVLFAIWNALKDAGIEIPYPHRVVEIKGAMPA
jgi:small-conductance mechanosensitive channel